MKGHIMSNKAQKLNVTQEDVVLDVGPGEEFVILMEWTDHETGELISFKPKVSWNGDSWNVGDTTLWLLERIKSGGEVVEYLRTTAEIASMVQGKKADHKRLVIKK